MADGGMSRLVITLLTLAIIELVVLMQGLSPASRAYILLPHDPGVPLRSTPGFMPSPAPRVLIIFVWVIVGYSDLNAATRMGKS
jgi:hypothetical protein